MTPILPAYAETLTPKAGNVYCMDALEGLRRLPANSIDMMLTSPPYDNLRTYNGYSFDFEGIARECYRVLKVGGVLVWVVGDATIDGSETLTSFRQALYFVDACGFKMHDTMIYEAAGTGAKGSIYAYWQSFEYMFVLSKDSPAHVNRLVDVKNKTIGLLRGGRWRDDGSNEKPHATNEYGVRTNIWRYKVGFMDQSDKTGHPAPFPEALARDHILTWSNPGDVVCDFFSGSGTTWKECLKADRQFIGFEISQEYVDLSKRRVANWKRDSDIEVSPGVVQMGLFANTA